jgi:8-oxo-dGTP pyrophosphatase MutT (NUDIX family)
MSTENVTTVFRGRVITVNVETVVLPNGHRTDLEVVHHPGGAAVVALDERQRVCVLRQFRHAAQGWLWELPAGKLEPPEPPLVTAQRELIEEAGVSASEWRPLGQYFSSPGVFTEVIHLFLAGGIAPAHAAPEASEVFEVHWIDLAEAARRAAAGDFDDGKTALGLLRAWHAVHGAGKTGLEGS